MMLSNILFEIFFLFLIWLTIYYIIKNTRQVWTTINVIFGFAEPVFNDIIFFLGFDMAVMNNRLPVAWFELYQKG